MAAQGVLVSFAVNKLGERPTLMLGLVLSIAGFLAIALAPSGAQFWWGVLLMAGGSISTPLINAFFSRRLGSAEQGRLQGATNSLNGVTGMLGPALFTQVFSMAVRGEARYGLVGAPDAPPYHASKGAVRLMSKTDALLYAADKIRVNSIHPGFIWTPMVEQHLAGQDDPAAARAATAALHPLGHMGEPDDIAWGAVYLASDEAKFVTGSELVIDGGYTAQ